MIIIPRFRPTTSALFIFLSLSFLSDAMCTLHNSTPRSRYPSQGRREPAGVGEGRRQSSKRGIPALSTSERAERTSYHMHGLQVPNHLTIIVNLLLRTQPFPLCSRLVSVFFLSLHESAGVC